MTRHFGLRPYSQTSQPVTTLGALLSHPKSFRDELALVLERFWQTGFRRDWRALEARLRDESFRMRDLRDERSTEELGRELNLPVVFDDRTREIRPKSGPPISYDHIDRCYLIPSAFNTRRWWAKYETNPQRVTVYLPITSDPDIANAVVEESSQPRERAPRQQQSINAESVFRALGDTTRYAIASILAREPTTSADLARSLNVSKPTITHHVQALRSAGLIAETPSHGSTKLSLSRDTVEALSDAAVEQLFSSSGDLALLTTRKRRKG
jgi:DNA-binding transcriptional ArsR family regulator